MLNPDDPKIAKCLARVRVLHFMHNDKFNAPFIELIRRHFDPNEHVFMFYSGHGEEFKIPDYENVIVLEEEADFALLASFFKAARQVIFHAFFYQEVVCYLDKSGLDLGQAYWVVWGGDMYSDRDLMHEEYFQIKRSVVQRLKGLILVAKDDYKIAQELYQCRCPFYHGLYKNPLDTEDLDRHRALRASSDSIVVQINNSCDGSILEILEKLSRFTVKKLKIRAILSYGNMAIQETILAAGKRLFGENFIGITDYVTPQKYAELLSDTDIAIMNQPRQQGLGNIYAFLYQGTKLYIRRDVTTWDFLRGYGFEIYDTLNLDGESFEEFSRFDDEVRKKNRQIAATLFDEKNIAGTWRQVFES